METLLHCSVNKCIDSCKQLTLESHMEYTNVYVNTLFFFFNFLQRMLKHSKDSNPFLFSLLDKFIFHCYGNKSYSFQLKSKKNMYAGNNCSLDSVVFLNTLFCFSYSLPF